MNGPQTHAGRTAGYQPEIDGLRALAVLAVVVFHLEIDWLPGGFVGVDVFLVISGYLISGILFAEYERTRAIDLRAFYYRRLKRIAPAFIATAIATTIGVLILFSPILIRQYAHSLWMAMLSVSNIGFYLTSGYFDTEAATKPLLHTWSLSVEEQFYLVWPLILLGVVRLRRRFLAIAILATLSLVAAQYVVTVDTDAAFYLMPFRIYEFALGALLHAPLAQTRNHRPAYDHLAVVVGVACILAACIGFSDQTPFPGVAALLPCLGTCAVIWGRRSLVAQTLLANRLFLWVGRTSYALYLVHWPLIQLYQRYRTYYLFRIDALDRYEIAILFLSAIAGAAVLNRWVEVPLRVRTTPPRRFVVATLTPLLVCALLGFSVDQRWFLVPQPWLPDSAVMNATYPTWLPDRYPSGAVCYVTPKQRCLPKAGTKTALFLGNSHVMDGANSMRRIRPTDRFAILDMNGCSARPDTPNSRRCKDPHNRRFDPEYLRQYAYIVISSLSDPQNPVDVRSRLPDALASAGVTRVVVFGNYLRTRASFDDMLQMLGTDETVLRSLTLPMDPLNRAYGEHITALGFFYIDKFQLLCVAGICPLFTPDGVPFSYDHHHLTRAFAEHLGDRAAPSVDAYLAEAP